MSLYEDVGGFDALLALCRRWHALCMADPIAEHPFSHGMHPQHDERLAAYLAEAFGGPRLYSAGYGSESSMQRLHAGNGEHIELDERCLDLFAAALGELPRRQDVFDYFRAATIGMRAYETSPDDVPDGLPFNRIT